MHVERTYKDALTLLATRRRRLSERWQAQQTASGDASSSRVGRPHIDGMQQWMSQLGLDHSTSNLRTIHVAGTKGKGSTCAFVASFLQRHGERTGFPVKIGLYTSPPLMTTRERIQINKAPISEQLFAKYTFELWEKLQSEIENSAQRERNVQELPRYRQFLMLLSLHVFAAEKVDVAVYETHSGGEYDCTNILSPVATGITTLGMDHVRALGPTIEDIAWHKAGIFKSGVPAFSVPQVSNASNVLERRAVEKGATLKYVTANPALPMDIPILQTDAQRGNASLAIALADSFLEQTRAEQKLTQTDITFGASDFAWPGRLQHVHWGQCDWFLDTAHNELSLKVATQWFIRMTRLQKLTPRRVLIFGHQSARNKHGLVNSIIDTMLENDTRFDHVIFSSLRHYEDKATDIDFHDDNQTAVSADNINEQEFRGIWRARDSQAQLWVENSVEEAIRRAMTLREDDCELKCFVTGHDRLIGPALSLLDYKI